MKITKETKISYTIIVIVLIVVLFCGCNRTYAPSVQGSTENAEAIILPKGHQFKGATIVRSSGGGGSWVWVTTSSGAINPEYHLLPYKKQKDEAPVTILTNL